MKDLPVAKKIESHDISNAMHRLHWISTGEVKNVIGNVIEAQLPKISLGTLTSIDIPGAPSIIAEVVGFKDQRSILLPYGPVTGISIGAKVKANRDGSRVKVGPHLLGHIVDAFLEPMYKPFTETNAAKMVKIDAASPNPMARERIHIPLHLGVKVIDGLLSFGEGQRICIMAGSGV
jgi:flagellum-specific ATP synthase